MELPIINALLRKIKERKLVFHPTPYLEDEEQYFGNLQSWKINFEKQYLQNIQFWNERLLGIKKLQDIRKFCLSDNSYFIF